MSNWKDIGKNVATLGIAWLLKKYVAKHLPDALVEVLDLAAGGQEDKVPLRVRAALDAIKQAHFNEQFGQMMAAQSAAEAKIRANLEKGARLAEDAAAARERGKK